MPRDRPWYDDISVIPRAWYEFFPRASMTVEERTNALVRLILYVTTAVYVYNRDPRGVALGFAAILVVSLMHRRSPDLPPMTAYGTTTSAPVNAPLGSLMSVGGQEPTSTPLPVAGEAACARSTPDNPFANHLLTDPADRPPACPYDDHKDAIRSNFNRNLFRNPEDVYERQNSQRQFFSMPYAKMPDTKAFAEFLTAPKTGSCKENPALCTGFR